MEFLYDKWWMVFPLMAVAGRWAGGWRRAGERRYRRRVELYKLQNQDKLQNQAREADRASVADVKSLMATHDATNRRWLDYELDVGKLIDFPLMTDVREPLTVAFLRAKRDHVRELRRAERAQRRDGIDGLEQVRLALAVVADEDVEAGAGREDGGDEVPEAVQLERAEEHELPGGIRCASA